MTENNIVESTEESFGKQPQVADEPQVGAEARGVAQTQITDESQKEKPDDKSGSLNLKNLLSQMDSKLADLKTQVGTLETEFKSKLKYDAHKEKIIDDLHREVQKYKNDLLRNLTRPIIMDIILTIDNITKLAQDLKAKDQAQLNPLKLIQQMEDIGGELEEILYRQGVDPFRCGPQEKFDSKQQKIVKTEQTDDPLKYKTVAKRLYKGYHWGDNVLRKERVNVYIPTPAATTAPETPPVDTVPEAKTPDTTTPEPNNNEENNHE